MIEDQLSKLTAAVEANTAVLEKILAAGTNTAVVSYESAPPAEKPVKASGKKAARQEPVAEPEPVQELPADPEPATEPEAPPVAQDDDEEVLTTTKVEVDVPKEEIGDDRPEVSEFNDPLDRPKPSKPAATISPEEVITKITDTWKAMVTAPGITPERRTMLKDKFPELRAKWGLTPDNKLKDLIGRPENLVGLLADIEAL